MGWDSDIRSIFVIYQLVYYSSWKKKFRVGSNQLSKCWLGKPTQNKEKLVQ